MGSDTGCGQDPKSLQTSTKRCCRNYIKQEIKCPSKSQHPGGPLRAEQETSAHKQGGDAGVDCSLSPLFCLSVGKASCEVEKLQWWEMIMLVEGRERNAYPFNIPRLSNWHVSLLWHCSLSQNCYLFWLNICDYIIF